MSFQLTSLLYFFIFNMSMILSPSAPAFLQAAFLRLTGPVPSHKVNIFRIDSITTTLITCPRIIPITYSAVFIAGLSILKGFIILEGSLN